MSALRRKAIEQTIVAELRAAGEHKLSKTGLRDRVIAELGPVPGSEFDAAIQALRYQGKLHWSRLELAASMLVQDTVSVRQGRQSPLELDALEGPAEAQGSGAAEAGPDDDDDYPGEVNDTAGAGAPRATVQTRLRISSAHAGHRTPPAPKHESEVQRAAREDAEAAAVRRSQARSTGTVRVPLELKRMMPAGEPTIAEAIQTAFVAEPHDLIATINRKHPLLWKRVIALGRATGKRPAQVLYDVLEAGLGQLEQGELSNAA